MDLDSQRALHCAGHRQPRSFAAFVQGKSHRLHIGIGGPKAALLYV